jgi:regulator of cell morphogenesis and NO signaling
MSAAPETKPDELPALVDLLESVHHAHVRRELARLDELLLRLSAMHGAQHPWLLDVLGVHRELERELVVHLAKEERVIFPYARALHAALSGASQSLGRPAFHTVRNPIDVLEREHQAVEYDLRRLREITSDLPEKDAGPTVDLLTRSMKELATFLEEHIELERKALYPRLVALEDQFFGAP